MERAAVMLLVAACGRVAFDELHDAEPASETLDGPDTSMLADCEVPGSALLCQAVEAGLRRWPTLDSIVVEVTPIGCKP